MHYYPVFLALEGRRCVVIGGGVIAERKVAGLLAAGARVTVVSPRCTDGIRKQRDADEVRWLERRYQSGDLAGAFLAIAATNDPQANEAVAREAEERGTLLNVVDVTPLCNFIAPSIIRRGPVTLAISTGGATPALAKKIRIALEESESLAYADMAELAAEVRAELRATGAAVDPEQWQAGLSREVLDLYRGGRREEARLLLLDRLQQPPSQTRAPAR